MIQCKAPIYTVHDNFLTTPAFSKDVPLMYSLSVIDMGSPLKMVNSFIFNNVIKPKLSKEKLNSLVVEDQFLNTVISKDILLFYLTENIPPNLSKNNNKVL